MSVPFPDYRRELSTSTLSAILDVVRQGSPHVNRRAQAVALGWTQIRLHRVIRRYGLSKAVNAASHGHPYEVATVEGRTAIRWGAHTEIVQAVGRPARGT